MKISKPIQPYSAKVVSEQDQTIFRCADVRKVGTDWKIKGYYNVVVKNLNYPIPKGNPDCIKITIKKSGVDGLTVDGSNVSIWADDISISDKNNKIIVQSTKKAAKYLGKKKSELLPKVEVEQEDGELFNAF